MNKQKHKIKYLISTIIILFIGIISLCSTSECSTSETFELTWKQFRRNSNYACFQHPAPFHGKLKGPDYLYVSSFDYSYDWYKDWGWIPKSCPGISCPNYGTTHSHGGDYDWKTSGHEDKTGSYSSLNDKPLFPIVNIWNEPSMTIINSSTEMRRFKKSCVGSKEP